MRRVGWFGGNQLLNEDDMKKPFEMTFPEFAEAVKLSGAVNRLPEMDRGVPVYSYSVFMNGEAAEGLAESSRKYDFKDVMVTALTRNLGLNPKSHQDNLKVSELVAARSAWLECVSAEHHRNQAWGLEVLSGDVLADYEVLTKGMVHPYIQAEIGKQKALGNGLQPVLDAAAKATGKLVENLAPDQVSVGKVVSQSTDFTVQETNGGEVVTHENRRLGSIPAVGGEVAITYYRGSGQVVDSLVNMKVSAPFIETKSGDLAVNLVDGGGKEQVILFNSLTGFDKFVKAHGLSADLVEQAVAARVATPKKEAPKPVRELTSEVYLDKESGCLAVDYKENGVPFTAMFGSSAKLEAAAKEYGLGTTEFVQARAMEASARVVSEAEVKNSLVDFANRVAWPIEVPIPGRVYIGPVVDESVFHIAQNYGRSGVVFHDKRDLDKVPRVGDKMTVKYENGRGQVEDLVREQGAEKGR